MNKNQALLNALNQMNRESRNTYDASMGGTYDPTVRNFTGAGSASVSGTGSQTTVRMPAGDPGVQYNITITSTLAAPLNVELFQFQASQTMMAQPSVNNYVPVAMQRTTLAHQFGTGPTGGDGLVNLGFGAFLGDFSFNTSGTPSNTNNIVGFDATGNLLYLPGYIGGVAGVGQASIACSQVPYRQMFNVSGTNPFRISKIRMTFNDDSQIDNQIIQVTKTYLGAIQSNQVTPRSYFRPDQFQSLIVDVPTPFQITPEIGLNYIINPPADGNATGLVKMNMFVQAYIKNQI